MPPARTCVCVCAHECGGAWMALAAGPHSKLQACTPQHTPHTHTHAPVACSMLRAAMLRLVATHLHMAWQSDCRRLVSVPTSVPSKKDTSRMTRLENSCDLRGQRAGAEGWGTGLCAPSLHVWLEWRPHALGLGGHDQ